jgi:hypothetical protein
MEIKPLDALQIAAMRKADVMCFHHRERQSYIRAVKRNAKTERNPFAEDVEIVIPCETRFVSYEKDESYFHPMPDFTAFEMEHCAQSSLDWQTTAAFLKVGDVVTLKWCRGAMNTQGADDIGWCGDYLKLQIARGDKKFSFHVNQCFVPRHSSARMIRDVRARRVEVSLVEAA